ncbi:MAG: beta-ketoacyl-[acyl-carrier-protein] synthase II [Myxococcales bacterium]|nr:beta-ketoacyl-[acyl-carrier-protein] synthase II [Myxococcales bacterium]
MQRVVITGIGMVTPCGPSAAETFANLLAGQSGIQAISLFDASEFPVRIAGECRGFEPKDLLTKKQIKETARFSQLSLVASRACLADSGIELSDEDRATCGTYIGVGLGGLEVLYRYSLTLNERGPGKISPYFIPQVIANLAAGQLAIELGLRGPSYSTTSACASSAHAIGDAADWIRLGRSQIMIAGGAESTITGLGIGGFAAMFALSRRNDAPACASRPWDRGRDGFVCSEGAATLLLESLDHARARGARIYAEVSGYGATCDGYHITQPAPDGRGAVAAMRQALSVARLCPSDIDYINAHGTSTPQGDVQEARAVLEVFGERARSDHGRSEDHLWVSSTKSAMGHLLGGAGAVEAAVCALAIRDGKVPPTLNLDDPEPDLPLDFVPHVARDRRVRHALSNSFGFGGTNASLILSAL